MQSTVNYGFRKPEPTDFYNVADHNSNMDAIDTALKEQADAIDAVQSNVQANTSAIRNVEASILSPVDIMDMIDSRPVTNATNAEWAEWADKAVYATNADSLGGKPAVNFMTRSSGRIDALGFDNENRLHIHIDGNLYRLPYGYDESEIRKYLLLTGGIMSGNLNLNGHTLIARHIDGYSVDNSSNNIHLNYGNQNADVIIYSHGVMGSALHTGNSAKVIVSATAPSDTNAVWIVPS